MDTLLPGITAERMPTSRLTVNVLSVAGRTAGLDRRGPRGGEGETGGEVGGRGRYREVVIEDAGHGPHLDQPERFLAELADRQAGCYRRPHPLRRPGAR